MNDITQRLSAAATPLEQFAVGVLPTRALYGEARDEIERLSTLYSNATARAEKAEEAMRKSEWQPIDTVPKDGTIVDLWHRKGFRVVDEWWDADDGWTGGWQEDQFTHWIKATVTQP